MTCQTSGESLYIYYFILTSQQGQEVDSIINPHFTNKETEAQEGLVFAWLARSDTVSSDIDISDSERQGLTALMCLERNRLVGRFIFYVFDACMFILSFHTFLFSWFLHRWVVSELNSLVLFSKFWEENRECSLRAV